MTTPLDICLGRAPEYNREKIKDSYNKIENLSMEEGFTKIIRYDSSEIIKQQGNKIDE